MAEAEENEDAADEVEALRAIYGGDGEFRDGVEAREAGFELQAGDASRRACFAILIQTRGEASGVEAGRCKARPWLESAWIQTLMVQRITVLST